MKIYFSTTSTVNFAKDINEEGIGFETEPQCYARLLNGGTTWETHWSQFTYTVLDDLRQDDRTNLVYDGAKNGFLEQDLLPIMEDVLVYRIDGSYGELFFAPEVTPEEAFAVYEKSKEAFDIVHQDTVKEIARLSGASSEKKMADIRRLVSRHY